MALWVVLRSRLLCRMFQKRGNKHFVGISIANAILSIDILSGGKLMGGDSIIVSLNLTQPQVTTTCARVCLFAFSHLVIKFLPGSHR